jgi:hypothetical protein
MKLLTYVALGGNALFILWVVYNAIDDGFQDIRSVQAIALLGLIALLALNIALLWRRE